MSKRPQPADWNDPRTVRSFLEKHPPTLMACAKLLEDIAERASTLRSHLWFLAAATLLKEHAAALDPGQAEPVE